MTARPIADGDWIVVEDLGYHVHQVKRANPQRITLESPAGHPRWCLHRQIVFSSRSAMPARILFQRLEQLREDHRVARDRAQQAYDGARAALIAGAEHTRDHVTVPE